MTQYKYRMIEQAKIDGRFYTQEETPERIVDEQHLERATSRETMRFFRRGLGSRQKIERRYIKGVYTIKIFSYSPVDENERTVHIYEEI